MQNLPITDSNWLSEAIAARVRYRSSIQAFGQEHVHLSIVRRLSLQDASFDQKTREKGASTTYEFDECSR